MTFDDGTTYTTPQIRGEKGDTGTGIASVVLNNNYTLTITLDDGTVYTTPSIRGQKGEKGDTGTGISSVALNGNYTLTITLDDGTTYTTSSIRGEKGDAGFSPTASVNKSGNVATITITDQNGTSTATITDGAKGDDGFSPTVAVSEINEGHRVVITDESGDHSFNVLDGESGVYIGDTEPSDPDVNVWIDTDEGADDVVTDVTVNGTSVVTDGVAEIPKASNNNLGVVKTSSNIGITSDGAIGVIPASPVMIKTGTDNERPITSGRQHISTFYGLAKSAGDTTQAQSDNAVGTYTNEAKSAIQSMLGVPSEDDVVTDVQVNGNSILNDGVANVPKASTSTLGVVRGGVAGVGINNDGQIFISSASDTFIKSGTNSSSPIVPNNQHSSTFYGLAKAAGDSTQSASSNAVGTYTDEAKIAIQKMLGIYEAPWELIREDTFTNAEEADHVITVDGNGEAFELTDAILQFETPKQDTASSFGGSGIIRFIYGNVSMDTYPGGYTQAANASARGVSAFLERKSGGLIITKYRNQTSNTNAGNLAQRFYENFAGYGNPITINNSFVVEKIAILKVTGTGHYKLYGKRKWN